MIRRTPRATLTETRFPYTTLVLAACTGRPLVNSSPPEKFTPAENAHNLSRRHRGHPVQRCVRLVRPERPHFGSRHQPAEEFRQGGEPLLVGDDAGTTEAVQVAELAEPVTQVLADRVGRHVLAPERVPIDAAATARRALRLNRRHDLEPGRAPGWG